MLQSHGTERRDRRKVRQLQCIQPTTPLTAALSLLLEAGVSVLPVVDEVRLQYHSCILFSALLAFCAGFWRTEICQRDREKGFRLSRERGFVKE